MPKPRKPAKPTRRIVARPSLTAVQVPPSGGPAFARAREINGQDAILIRPMAYVTLTIDHRVVDGHQTNAWLTRFVEILENWAAA